MSGTTAFAGVGAKSHSFAQRVGSNRRQKRILLPVVSALHVGVSFGFCASAPKGFTLWKPDRGFHPLTHLFTLHRRGAVSGTTAFAGVGAKSHSFAQRVGSNRRQKRILLPVVSALHVGVSFGFCASAPKGFTLWKPDKGFHPLTHLFTLHRRGAVSGTTVFAGVGAKAPLLCPSSGQQQVTEVNSAACCFQ